MVKAHVDIYRKVMAQIEHELDRKCDATAKLSAINSAIEHLRAYEKLLKQTKVKHPTEP